MKTDEVVSTVSNTVSWPAAEIVWTEVTTLDDDTQRELVDYFRQTYLSVNTYPRLSRLVAKLMKESA